MAAGAASEGAEAGALRDAAIVAADDELARQCELDRYRASGPGGQHRNKTESAVRARHLATGVSAHADDSRSQHENRGRALRRLRMNLALEVRAPVAGLDDPGWTPDAPLAGLVAAGAAAQGERTRQTPAFWLAAAHLLDLFVACGAEVAPTAARLGVGTAPLARLLTCDDALLRVVNQHRARRSLRPLR
ncbi:MAG TPA: peptide chain release factor-like protein [Kofleriaceae bacterium]|nr:peptide chain release factor-like protein [Kofleriaceae bacterium]